MSKVYDDDTCDFEASDKVFSQRKSKEGKFSPSEPEEFNVHLLPPLVRGPYFKAFGVHFNVSAIAKNAPPDVARVLCRRLTYKEDCPFCRAVQGIYNQARAGEVENKKLIEIANKTRGKARYVVNIVDMDKPKSGVMTWEFADSFFDKLHPVVKRYMDKHKKFIGDPVEGEGLAVTFIKKQSFIFPDAVAANGDNSPIEVKNWRESRKDFDEYIGQYEASASEMRKWLTTSEKDLLEDLDTGEESDTKRKIEDDLVNTGDDTADAESLDEIDPDADPLKDNEDYQELLERVESATKRNRGKKE